MNDGENFETEQLRLNLQDVASTVRQLAEAHRGNSSSLLLLLRVLEDLHREIRDSLFQESLPDNRQALYNLLKDIESSGGWPYIHRMKLQLLLANLRSSLDGDLASTLSQPLPPSDSQEATN
ncbi:hypothetical protein K9N68_26410 [Kovacikia minuta CCNUW1]|uniref:hypothetical protein n=1 Tax=Kovacikia minuta TaxID=2931930 RepID=UPI001CCFCB4E|nr:hypothetical protein [Kovacikia minuta]UBF25135.1 hypothetical protein K9N68_26410 [Kovacikia minuta CCNUW1]